MNFNTIPTMDVINKTTEALKNRGINVILVNNKEEALDKLKSTIPPASKIMNGSSTSLIEIGFMDYLKSGKHPWKNLIEEILQEKDWIKQSNLRRRAIVDADYFLGSINAISEDGQLVAVDASGSRVGAYPFAAGKLILVAGVQKIVPNLENAMSRIREYVFPLEDARAKKAYGMESALAKWIIIEREMSPQRTTLILVKEKLGY